MTACGKVTMYLSCGWLIAGKFVCGRINHKSVKTTKSNQINFEKVIKPYMFMYWKSNTKVFMKKKIWKKKKM